MSRPSGFPPAVSSDAVIDRGKLDLAKVAVAGWQPARRFSSMRRAMTYGQRGLAVSKSRPGTSWLARHPVRQRRSRTCRKDSPRQAIADGLRAGVTVQLCSSRRRNSARFGSWASAAASGAQRAIAESGQEQRAIVGLMP